MRNIVEIHMKKGSHIRKPIVLLPVMALVTLFLFWLLPYQSTLVENVYSRGVFAGYRVVWDHTISLLPFGVIYVVILFALLYPLSSFFNKSSFKTKWWLLTKRLIMLVSLAILMFYWLWGFNYKRQSFRSIVDLSSSRPDVTYVLDEYCRVTDSLIAIRTELNVAGVDSFYVSEQQLKNDLKRAYQVMGLPTYGNVRARKIRPKGSLLHISTAGVYLPFAGEGHIDAGLHPITHPFTMMHEMSHGYGWTGEDVCNFLALMAAINSEDLQVRYSGYFGYWRYLRSQVFQIDRADFDLFYRAVPPEVLKDYQDINTYAQRYKDIMPELRDLFYDRYLKSHGISSGLINYSQMIVLTHEWKAQHGDLLLERISDTQRQ